MSVLWKRKDIVQWQKKLYVVLGKQDSSYRVFEIPVDKVDTYFDKAWRVSIQMIDYAGCKKVGVYEGDMPDEGYEK